MEQQTEARPQWSQALTWGWGVGVQIGSGRESGGGQAIGVSVKGQGREQVLSNEQATGKKLQESSSWLSVIYAYLTCLITESLVPFCSQISTPNSS